MTSIKGPTGPRLPTPVEPSAAPVAPASPEAPPATVPFAPSAIVRPPAEAPRSDGQASDDAKRAFAALAQRLAEPSAGAGGKFAIDGLKETRTPAELPPELLSWRS